MAELPYMPFFVDAYTLDAGHLTEQEHGVYLRLLMLAWVTPECRVPNDDAWLARRLSRPLEIIVSIYRPIIAEFFQTDGNWIWQKRQQKEWQRSRSLRAKQSDNAKSRWNKEKGACRGNAVAMPTIPTPTVTEEKGETPLKPPRIKRDPTERGSFLPVDWTPSEADRAYARTKGYSDVEIDTIAEEFRLHWLGASGPDARKRNWSAAWQKRIVQLINWGRGPASRSPGNGGGGGGNRRAPDRPAGRVAQSLEVLRRRGSLAGQYVQ